MTRLTHIALACALAGGFALPSYAAQRAYVKSTGSDGNTATGCTLAAPCRGFTAAHSVVDPGGEIVALDAAGYGAVTITKSVTITANPGFFAGIAASTGNAITIATAAVSVTLRGLQINGIGADYGILMTDGASLNIENCVIANFVEDGANVNSVERVRVVNSLIRNNSASGLRFGTDVTAEVINSQMLDNGYPGLFSSPSGSNKVTVTDSVLSGNVWGIVATTGGSVTIIRSSANHNTFAGFQTEGGLLAVGNSSASHNGSYGLRNVTGALGTYQNNLAIGNVTGPTNGVITPIPGG